MKNMVEKFQCPGCVAGGDTTCGAYNFDGSEQKCTGHVLGTSIGIGNSIALGLPKLFNKPGYDTKTGRSLNTINVRLWPEGKLPQWDWLNTAVWAMVEDDHLFVRTYSPRINHGYVDVIENGTLDMAPEGCRDVTGLGKDCD